MCVSAHVGQSQHPCIVYFTQADSCTVAAVALEKNTNRGNQQKLCRCRIYLEYLLKRPCICNCRQNRWYGIFCFSIKLFHYPKCRCFFWKGKKWRHRKIFKRLTELASNFTLTQYRQNTFYYCYRWNIIDIHQPALHIYPLFADKKKNLMPPWTSSPKIFPAIYPQDSGRKVREKEATKTLCKKIWESKLQMVLQYLPLGHTVLNLAK